MMFKHEILWYLRYVSHMLREYPWKVNTYAYALVILVIKFLIILVIDVGID